MSCCVGQASLGVHLTVCVVCYAALAHVLQCCVCACISRLVECLLLICSYYKLLAGTGYAGRTKFHVSWIYLMCDIGISR